MATFLSIDPTTYFPVAAIQETYVAITAGHARGAKAFFEKYKGSGVFSLHRDNYVGGGRFRHHAIYPDVTKLLGHPDFSVVFRERLLSLDAHPTYIITPPHDAGVAMAKAAVGECIGLDLCIASAIFKLPGHAYPNRAWQA